MYKKLYLLPLLAVALLQACGGNPPEPEKTYDAELTTACHYIWGGGQTATGGEGGTIYFVSRLDDELDPESGKPMVGTLRYAVEAGEPRMILFRVAGTIHLKKELILTRGNVTIAGQSAPGDGICIADYPLVIKNAENVIVRFLRIRLGNESLKQDANKDYDALSVNDSRRVVIDHCSCSWSVDECVSCYGNTDFTLQYCFITESLRNAGHVKGAHGYGGIWGGANATFHHNLLAHHDSRNPRFDHDYVSHVVGPIDYVNNVVYNWGGNSTYGGEGNTTGGGARQVNFLGNYYKAGPSTKSSVRTRLCNPTTKCSNCGGTILPMQLFLKGNVMEGATDVTADNWLGVHPDDPAQKDACRASAPFDYPGFISSIQPAEDALETVLTKAGCSYRRDALDTRIVSDVRNGQGRLIDTPADAAVAQAEAGGWPLLSGTPEPDTDRDGIPDAWEEAHGLNPRSFADHKEHTLVEGHTNLEAYLCDIVQEMYLLKKLH